MSENLLNNGSFEGGWYHPNGVPELQIPNGWEFWFAPPSQANPHDHHEWQRPEVRTLPSEHLPEDERSTFIFDGDYTIKIFKWNWYARFSQRVTAYGAATLRTPVWASLVKGYRDDGRKIWADDPGGHDGMYRYLINGVATEWRSFVAGRRNNIQHQFTATGETEIGIEFMCPFPLPDTTLFLDGWSLTAAGGSVPPKIMRVYNLLPQDATLDEYWQVAQKTYAKRQTIGFSADDAGELIHFGTNTSKVVAWSAERIGTGLTQEWFNQNYPGSAMQLRWFGSPLPALPSSTPVAAHHPLPEGQKFTRVYNLLPQDATLDEYWWVAKQTHETRETIGFSADDAGYLAQHGTERSRVVAWSPDRIGTGLTHQWFDENYPGAAMESRYF